MTLTQIDWSDAYGAGVETLFEAIQPLLAPTTETFVQAFYQALSQAARITPVLERLGAQQFEELQRKQARYFKLLMTPTLSIAEHLDAARQVGRVHALVGVDLLWLIEAYSLYQNNVQQAMRAWPVSQHDHDALMWAVARRLTLDLQAQAESYRQIEVDGAQTLIQLDQLALTAESLPDLLGEAMRILGSLDGLLGGLIARPDTNGRMHAEIASPGSIQAYVEAINSGAAPMFSTSPEDVSGRGPAGRAWRSGTVQWTDNYERDPSLNPWTKIGSKLGFRSNVAIPLMDEAGQSMAILSLYSAWPGYFSTATRRAFVAHVQQVLSLAFLRFQNRRAVPYQERQAYRRLLNMRRVEMLYQPIIELRQGHLRKVEALARLRGDDGTLIAPGRFLPAFGNVDLLSLFEQGLERVCDDLRNWKDHGLTTQVSINFPPQGMIDPAYQDILFRKLESACLEPRMLHLELLESEEIEDLARRDRFVARLREMGIKLSQDDLGSGHSTLLRMDSFPFDEVKIDQGFVRTALGKPQRGLEFIRHLTRLAHDLGTIVTIEGLEDAGLIEAAAILGADAGQGYGIARPMAAADLPAWHRSFVFTVDPFHPRTALGALAGYLLWERQLEGLGDRPQLISEFVASPCAVAKFIAANHLEGSALDALLARNHRYALQGHRHPVYLDTKKGIVELLAEQARAPSRR